MNVVSTLKEIPHRILCWLSAVFVNTLLNLMDSVTYGRILFPIQAPLFMEYETLGISMYLLATAMSQLVISLGSSFQRGATGCAMVENIPFYHSISLAIATRVIDRNVMISTILAAYMLSALLTGLLFMMLALMNLDRLVHKIPRVVLVGSMGGIGIFLILTGLEMATNESLYLQNVTILFSSWITLSLWFIGLAAAVGAFAAELKFNMAFVTPLISLTLFCGFYLVYPFQPFDLSHLRELGWLLNFSPGASMTLKDVFSKFSITAINWKVLLRVFHTVVAASFFGSLHVPINIPSYARITRQTFSIKRELWVQAISNWVTTIFGFIPNYFVYTNSLLFLRAGGAHRAAGVLLSLSTIMTLIYGLKLLGFVPTVIPLFLIFYLGIHLLWEALVGSMTLCTHLEYAMIVITSIGMQTFGFIFGILIGIIASVIHAIFIRCASRGHSYIEEEGDIANPVIERECKQLLERSLVLVFEGYLYFGNTIEALQRLTFSTIDSKLLIIDFGGVSSMDMNFREGFLAFISSRIIIGEHQVVCLNINDSILEKSIKREHLCVQFGTGSPRKWIKDQLLCLCNIKKESRYEEDTLLMVPSNNDQLPTIIYTTGKDKEAFDNDRMELDRILTKLKAYHATTLLLHRGEPVISKIPSGGGIVVIQKGRIRRRTRHYQTGSWVGLKEATAASAGLTNCIASSQTSAIYIPMESLSSLSVAELSFLQNLAFYYC